MKRICCSKCREEIGSHDFFMVTKGGKICSDCLVKAEAKTTPSAYLFKQRGPKGQTPQAKEKSNVIVLPFKEAL
ncbi:hypothetical protein OAN24_01635 [Pseudodesulfovibrio sp.]|nr:hypothetical protein [Pseudodesulfovibrio sp.]